MENRIPQKIKQILQEIELMPGHKNYTKFIILGRSRTGSNFLRGLLRDHPQIVSSGEILRSEADIDWDSNQYPLNEKVLSLYRSDPVRFLDEIVFKKFPKSIKAVGFKLFYYHAQTAPFQKIWDVLKEDTTVHILHIKRKNILKTHLSRAQANQSGSWVNITGKKEAHQPIELDPQACLKDFEQTRQWENDFDRFFKDHPMKEITYETLSKNYPDIIQEIQGFLGLNSMPVTPQTYKQSSLPLSASIKNFDTLQAYFSNTPWADFFEEGR